MSSFQIHKKNYYKTNDKSRINKLEKTIKDLSSKGYVSPKVVEKYKKQLEELKKELEK